MEDAVTDKTEKISEILDNDEKILWSGAPEFWPFIFSGLWLLIFGLLWGLFDLLVFILPPRNDLDSEPGLKAGIMLFMVIHMFPCWFAIANQVRLFFVHKNTFYAITNKRVLFRSGLFGTDFQAIDHDTISDTTVDVGPIANLFKVGTIKINNRIANSEGTIKSNRIYAVHKPYEVFKILKTISVDVKTDWNYPNKLRPAENPGYQTNYIKKV